jgi:hypothetical protein
LDGNYLKASFVFDQPVQFADHSLRLLLAADVSDPASISVLQTIDFGSSPNSVQLAADGRSLAISVPKPSSVAGFLAFDLGAPGHLLRNSDGLALTIAPLQYGLNYDSAPPRITGHAFTVKDSSVSLEVDFSEPVKSTGKVQLESINPITGLADVVAELKPSSTPLAGQDPLASNTVLFNFADLISNLSVIPGGSYRLLFDSATGLQDASGNGANLSLDISVPYPQTPEFQLARSQSQAISVQPYSFYFTLADGNGSPSSASLLPFAQPLSGVTFATSQITTSKVVEPISSGQELQLQLWLYGQNRNELGPIDLELVYPSQEIWFDTDQLEAISGVHVLENTRDLGNNRDGLLRFRLDPSVTATSVADGKRLVSLPCLSLPVGSGQFQPDTSPAIVLRRVIDVGTSAPIEPTITSLPQLLLTKHNTLSNQSGPLLLCDPSVNEGATLTIAVATNLAADTSLYWQLSGTGIDTSDFTDGRLDGAGKVDGDGKITISIDVANDMIAEKDEILHLQLYRDANHALAYGDAAQATIKSKDLRVGNGSYDAARFRLKKVDLQVFAPGADQVSRLMGRRSADHQLNTDAVEFTAQLNKSATKVLNTALDFNVVGGSLDLIDNKGVRLGNRRLAYFSIDGTGSEAKISTLTYDPLKRAGARFYDRNGDGVADFLSLALVDGGYGDKDQQVNGSILDPSTAATVDLNPVLTKVGSSTLTVGDPSNLLAPASVVLKASLGQRVGSVNQIGYVVLDAAELATADSLLSNFNTFKSRAQTLFSSLGAGDTTLQPTTSFDRELLLLNGQSVRFFEVANATLDEISSFSDSRLTTFSVGQPASPTSVSLTSVDGLAFDLSLLSKDQGLNALIGQEQGSAALLDFTSFAVNEKVKGQLILAREASFDSITGFYRTVDTLGSVLAPNGDLLTPGIASRSDYLAAALRDDNIVGMLSGLKVANRQAVNKEFEIASTSYLAPFAQVNGDSFFSFAGANIDGISHFRVLGTNMFGLEDLRGGGDRDFNDVILGFSFSSVI